MNRINIYRSTNISTSISNVFIDEYMQDANDAQLKIYLFLIRMMSANLPTSVTDIADKFNYTEKDVLRSLMYWESKGLLALDYDARQNLSGIQVLSLDNPVEISTPKITPVLSFIRPAQNASVSAPVTASVAEYPVAPASPKKPAYSMDDLRAFKNNEETSQLLFVAETYLGRQLSRQEMETILFFSDELHFSADLIDYLIQHCVELGKKDMRYIEKVALSWAEQGITTVKQACNASKKYDKNVYTIMKALGKNTTPAPKELDYIKKWTNDYGFLLDVIQEACDKTVMTTDSHRFAYADGILSKWYQAGVQRKEDIVALDSNYKAQAAKPAVTKVTNVSNKFNRFSQNDYDFDEYEQNILSN